MQHLEHLSQQGPLFGGPSNTHVELRESEKQRELEDYDALVSHGGRPSHPRELFQTIVEAPGEYRDILGYWQHNPNDCKVFSKQLQSWWDFQDYQRNVRTLSSNFSEYASDVDVCLADNGFKYPASAASASVALDKDLRLQGDLGTWMEYIYRQYCKQDGMRAQFSGLQQDYEAALGKLLTSGSLAPHEREPDMLERLSDPGSKEMARLMIKRRFWDRLDRGQDREALVLLDERIDAMTGFYNDTLKFRRIRAELKRHGVLIRWALAQIPLIEKEAEEKAAAAEAEAEAAPSPGPQTFERFMRLPPEIRRTIWLDCLPAGPSSHFFDIINHPSKGSMAHGWSSREFGVSATSERDSGYLLVYTLLAACRDSRITVEAHYRHRRHGTAKTFEGWSSPEKPFGNFETFDWIPADDLVVLCFPPRKAQLPSVNALTFFRGPRRHVGILVTLEMYHLWGYGVGYNNGRPNSRSEGWRMPENIFWRRIDDGSQVNLIPSFLSVLGAGAVTGDNEEGQGGVGEIHVIVEGLTAKSSGGEAGEPRDRLAWYLHRPLEVATRLGWHNCGASPWTAGGADGDEYRPPGSGYTTEDLPRRHWRLGTSEGRYLIEPIPTDCADGIPIRHVTDFASMVWESCVAKGWPETTRCFMLGYYDVDDVFL